VGAPKNTPLEIVGKLNREINAALVDPKIKAPFAKLSGTVLAKLAHRLRWSSFADETESGASSADISGGPFQCAAKVTASARSLPALRCSIDEDSESIMTCTYPPDRPVSAGADWRYGTWVMSTPAINLRATLHLRGWLAGAFA
jgi:hypothetical protein